MSDALLQADDAVVLQILIPSHSRPDILLWPAMGDGHATVRSAYHAIHSTRVEVEDGDGQSSKQLWSPIWTTRVWPKVQTFMWKLGTDFIATKQNLVKRGVPTSVLCLTCAQTESREHLFLECRWVRQVWTDLLQLNVAGVTVSMES